MAWRRPGDKPLSEPMMVSLLTHICVTRPQWVKVSTKCRPQASLQLFPTLSPLHSHAYSVVIVTIDHNNVFKNCILTHWGSLTHICISELNIIDSDNGLSPGRRQAIISTNAGILLIRPLETNFSEILIGNQTFSFKKMYLKMASVKWCPFCLGLNVFKKCCHFL